MSVGLDVEIGDKRHFIVFDKWSVERKRFSALVVIGDLLKCCGHEVEYFWPQCFNPTRDMPNMPEDKIDGIWTWNWAYFGVQNYYRSICDVYLVDYGFLARDKGYQFILKNNHFPIDKPDDRFKSLQLESINQWNPNGHVLVCTQNHHNDWYRQTINDLKLIVKKGREIRIRKRQPRYEIPLKEDLQGAFAMVTYNSTALYTALLYHVPVYCHMSCPASDFCSTSVEQIEQSTEIKNSKQLLSNVAYSQWTLDEMKEGLFLGHL